VVKSLGLIPRNAQAKAARNLNAPLLTSLWAAGLSFSRCHFERRVSATAYHCTITYALMIT